MANYILSAPGDTAPVLTIQALDSAGNVIVGNLTISSLQDLTISNTLDTFQWQQLDTTGKFTVPTTSNNQLSGTIVVDPVKYKGTVGPTGTTAPELGLLNLAKKKTQVKVTTNLGNVAAGGTSITCTGYVTGLDMSVTADSPVWTSPLTISITGDYTYA